MKKHVAVLLFSSLWFFLSAMGLGPETEVPEPKMDFRVSVTDDQEITTKISKATWQGDTYFGAMRGRGAITIPFEKTRKMIFVGKADRERVEFQVTLKTGDVVAVTFSEQDTLAGVAGFGTYKIKARNIKELVFE